MTSDVLRSSKSDIQVRSEYFAADVGKRGDIRSSDRSDRLAGPFKIGTLLGRGITGSVRVGIHVETGFQVALKCVKKKYLKEKEERWNTFRREMAVMKMMDHPHIIKLYDVFESSSRIYLVCEYVKGGELFDYISTNGLPKDEALRLFAQILLAIQHAHDYGIVHRDLKPENILLDDEKNIKIGDFGMARFIKDGIVLHTSCGSPHYTSPEVIAGSYDGRISDVWSLGVIFYAMVSGCLPFNDENLSVMFDLIQAGNFDIPPEVDQDCQDLIRDMLQVDTSKRIRIEDIPSHRAFRGTHFFPVPFRSMSGLFSPCASPSSISTCSSPLSSPGIDPLVSPKYSSLKLPSSYSTSSLPSSPMGSPRSLDMNRIEGKLDSHLIEDMLSLGTWESRDDIISKLQETETNNEKAIYRLLSERKRARLDELSRLSPRRVSRTLLPRIASVPAQIHKSSSLATSTEFREDLPEFDLPPARDETSQYLDSPRSTSTGRSPSPRTPRRIDLRVQIAKARKAKLDPDASPVMQNKSVSQTGSPRISSKPDSPKLFSHPLPEFITTDDIRSLQPYIQTNPSPVSSTRKESTGPMSDEIWAASLSQMLKQLATTTRPSSPTQARAVARAFFPKSGSKEDDKKKGFSGSIKPKERQSDPLPRTDEKDTPGRLSTSTSSRRSSTSSIDADPDSPSLTRRSLQAALDSNLSTPTPEKQKDVKRSAKLPPKKTPDASPVSSPIPSASGSSSPILQWFSSFFRRRPSLDPWQKVGAVKDPASARYQARNQAKIRTNFFQKTFPPTPKSTSGTSTPKSTSGASTPGFLTPPTSFTPKSRVQLATSIPTTTEVLAPSISRMVTSVSLEGRKKSEPARQVFARTASLPMPFEPKEEEEDSKIPRTESEIIISYQEIVDEKTRDRSQTSDSETSKKGHHRRAQRSGSLPMPSSIESKVKQRKRQTQQRTPSNTSLGSVPSSPSLRVPKKSFFGRYRRLKPSSLSTSSSSSSASTSVLSGSIPPSPAVSTEDDSSSRIPRFFKPKKNVHRKRNKSHESLRKRRGSADHTADGTKSAPGSALATPDVSPAFGSMGNPFEALTLSEAVSTSSAMMTIPELSLPLSTSGARVAKSDREGDLVFF